MGGEGCGKPATVLRATDARREQDREGEAESQGSGKHHGGNGSGDAVRLWERGLLRGVWASRVNNAANPRTGSGMQQARRLEAEETVEGVQNPEDGTRDSGAAARFPKSGLETVGMGVDALRNTRWRGDVRS